jgi:hypothetical protein
VKAIRKREVDEKERAEYEKEQSEELIDSFEQELEIDTTSKIKFTPESITNSVTARVPEPIIKPTPELATVPEPVQDTQSKSVQVAQSKPVEEAVKEKNKMSLWQRFLSIFGFNK